MFPRETYAILNHEMLSILNCHKFCGAVVQTIFTSQSPEYLEFNDLLHAWNDINMEQKDSRKAPSNRTIKRLIAIS